MPKFPILLVRGCSLAFAPLVKICPLKQLVRASLLSPSMSHVVRSVTFYVFFLFVAVTMSTGEPTVVVRTCRFMFLAPNSFLRVATWLIWTRLLPKRTLPLTPSIVMSVQSRVWRRPVRANPLPGDCMMSGCFLVSFMMGLLETQPHATTFL